MEQAPRFCGIALVIGFFLPFISMGPISCSGLDLVKGGQAMDEVSSAMGGLGAMSENGEGGGSPSASKPKSEGWKLKIIALIPLVGLVSAIANKKPLHFVSGAIPIAILGLYVIDDSDVIKALGIGAWLCLAAGIGQIALAAKGPSEATVDGPDPGGGGGSPPIGDDEGG